MWQLISTFPTCVGNPCVETVDRHDGVSIFLGCKVQGAIYHLTNRDFTFQHPSKFSTICSVKGQISSLALQNGNPGFLVTDNLNNRVSLVSQPGPNLQIQTLINDFDGQPLNGPSCLIQLPNDNLVFTDSNPKVANSGKLLLVLSNVLFPIYPVNLDRPTGVAASEFGDLLFVCETGANRLLRYHQKPRGVFHQTTFHQFSGDFACFGIAVDKNGFIYVAQKNEQNFESMISVLSPTGKLVANQTVPEINLTGIAVFREFLYITCGKALYRCALHYLMQKSEN